MRELLRFPPYDRLALSISASHRYQLHVIEPLVSHRFAEYPSHLSRSEGQHQNRDQPSLNLIVQRRALTNQRRVVNIS